VAVADLLEAFEVGFAYVAGRFSRVEPRRQARAFVLGLLSDVDTRSCWQLAEQAGDRSPHRMQRLLGETMWDADAVRDDGRRYTVDELGDPNAVLIIDDTGDLKASNHTVGVQRQYTGTAGRVENAQVAVFLAYASHVGYMCSFDHRCRRSQGWRMPPLNGTHGRCAVVGYSP
jgi:SRSO17 transposase